MSDEAYADREGYVPDFLEPGNKGVHVHLPALSAQLQASAVPLLSDAHRNVLAYHHFSVVMHGKRRFAIYSAANVDFKGRLELNRPKDVWRIDPRIPAQAQVSEAFYHANQFDRGHLSRREDLEFGVDAEHALAAAADTCHWTNCTPQHARFNESAQLWQGLERHILEKAVARDRFRAQVITGPVFGTSDPVLVGFEATPYPLRYWKVVAAINAAGRLFATAYVLDQSDVIKRFGTRAAPAIPFPPFKTFQTRISVVEQLTGLAFSGSVGGKDIRLSAFDPLSKEPAKGRARSADGNGPNSTMIELAELDDVVLSD